MYRRYVQRIECLPPVQMGNPQSVQYKPKASVRLEEIPLTSSMAMVKGAVYYFAFHTERYCYCLVQKINYNDCLYKNVKNVTLIYNRYSSHPLIVEGPLSDSANTASGIVGDILRIAKSLGAKDQGHRVVV